MEGLVPQLIAAGVGGGIVALLGLIGVLFRIFVRLGRLEKAVEVLDAGLKTTQDDVKELQRNLHQTEIRLRQEFREEIRQSEERLREFIRAENEATRREIRRLTDAFVAHSHEPDGTIVYRIPPPQYPPSRADGGGD